MIVALCEFYIKLYFQRFYIKFPLYIQATKETYISMPHNVSIYIYVNIELMFFTKQENKNNTCSTLFPVSFLSTWIFKQFTL